METKTPFIWHELVTTDQKKSGSFFCELLDWTFKEVDAGEFGTYTLFQKDGIDIAGMMYPTSNTPGVKSYWHSYIAVDDVNDCAKRTSLLGGKVLVSPHNIPDVGRICIVSDPTGAVTHLIQPTDISITL